jgi:hypothetical protein
MTNNERINTMVRTLNRWLSPLWLTLLILAGPSYAQQQPEKIERGVTVDPNAGEKSDPVPVPQYALAGFATIIIMVIICKPSRKAYRE